MKLYDFDHTIYRGDCAVDFYLFCIGRQPGLLRYFPLQAWHTLLFLLKVEDRTTFKGNFFMFLRGIQSVPSRVDDFWIGHASKIKRWYLEHDRSEDVIVSASPEFLLQPACHRLGVRKLLATKMDPRTGTIEGVNCRGREKVRRFQDSFPAAVVEEAYSDHASDAPMLKLAQDAFIVIGDKLLPIREFKRTSKLKIFLMRLS